MAAYQKVNPAELVVDPRLGGLFPPADDTVKALVEDMRANGYRESRPIEVWRRGGKLIVVEGHTRREAAIMAGIKAVPIVAPRRIRTLEDAFSYAVREQRLRRNLSGDALVTFVIGVLEKLDEPTYQGKRSDLTGYSAEDLADMCGCSRPTIERARRLLRSGDGELLAKVRTGELGLQAAIRKLAAKTEAPDPAPRASRTEPKSEAPAPEPSAAEPEDDADTFVWDLRGMSDGLVDLVEDARALKERAGARTRVTEQVIRCRAALDEIERLFA